MTEQMSMRMEMQQQRPEWPAVTCLCPTYGRFECLRLALSCFLAQDYPGEKRLLILNDAPVEIRLGQDGQDEQVMVQNVPPGAFGNLGEKRQWLLENCCRLFSSSFILHPSALLCAHWDDDDLYLPWHLTRSVAALLAKMSSCVKSRGAWYMTGSAGDLTPSTLRASSLDARPSTLSVRGPCHNVFEGTMVFNRAVALDLGGYPPLHSGQAKALMSAFSRANALYEIRDADSFAVPQAPSLPSVASAKEGLKPLAFPSYVYRWANAVGHISGIGNRADAADAYRAQNQDFGGGRPLTPGDPRPYMDALLAYTSKALSWQAGAAFGGHVGPLTGVWNNPPAGDPMPANPYAAVENAGRPRP